MKRFLRREDVERDPDLIWHEFIKLLAYSQIEELDATQLSAHLAFWYDSEVQNGGHHQFFANHSTELVPQRIEALQALGAPEQAALLKAAFDRWNTERRRKPRTTAEYVAIARMAEFEDLDAKYYSVRPSITELLEKCLEANRGAFIELVD
jgi:hypothetical protein